MRWQAKAALHQAFSRMPGGGYLHQLAQARTGSLDVSPALVARMRAAADRHWAVVSRLLSDTAPGTLRGYEFGAGWHLGVAFALAGRGVGRQTLVDRAPLARPELALATLDAMASVDDEGRLSEGRGVGLEGALAGLGITYLAPRDARSTGLPGGSFDFATSTSTLEHIPVGELGPILRECHRLLRPGGVLSALIDYGDHYAHTDRAITAVNFLQFSPRRWRLFSPPSHFQNRLRHSEHVARLEAAGFEVTTESLTPGGPADYELVRSGGLHPDFRDRDVDDLCVREAHLVARKV